MPLIVSAPSGTGKSTVIGRVMAMEPVHLVVSVTTRPPRAGERQGVDYTFVTPQAFDRMVEEGAFLEWVRLFHHCYGTPRSDVEPRLARGEDLIFDVDVEGAFRLREALPQAEAAFLLPPSLEDLEARLKGRGTDDDQALLTRLSRARGEMDRAWEYDYIVINDNLDAAVEDMRAILRAGRRRVRRMGGWLRSLGVKERE